MKLTILIPVYNEEKTVSEVVQAVKQTDISPVQKEIIVIDDGSTDNTLFVLKEIQGIILLSHEKNSGKGYAIRTGLRHTTGEMILIQDADMEYDPGEYKHLLEPILNGTADVVYGSRILNTKNQKGASFSFYFGGRALTLLTNILFPYSRITDEPTCYKLFRADVLKSISLECTKFEFCPEVTAKILKRGIPIHEVPISYYPRSQKEGKKIKWRDGVDAAWTLIKYRFAN